MMESTRNGLRGRVELAGNITVTIGVLLMLAALAMWTPWIRSGYGGTCFFTGAAFALSSAMMAATLGEVEVVHDQSLQNTVTRSPQQSMTESERAQATKFLFITCLAWRQAYRGGENHRVEEKLEALYVLLANFYPGLTGVSNTELIDQLREVIIANGGMCD